MRVSMNPRDIYFPLRREGRAFSASPVVFPAVHFACAFCAQRAMGASRHPVFPAPSVHSEEQDGSKPRARPAARMLMHVRCLKCEFDVSTTVIASEAKQSRVPPRKDSGLL